METPEEPREGTAARLGKSAEAYGLAGASWAGRGDEAQGLSLLELAVSAGLLVSFFMPWLGEGGRTIAGWNMALVGEAGLVALSVVLVELLALAGAWASRGSAHVTFCLVAAAGVLGVSAFADVRWNGLLVNGFASLDYGAWLGLVLAILLILLASLRPAGLWRSIR